jgi:hypothetical protein
MTLPAALLVPAHEQSGAHTQERRERSEAMLMSQYASKAFLKLDDVREAPLREVIKDVKIGSYDKPDLVFESGNTLSLNKTNVRALIKAFGEDSRDWIGCEVEVYAGEISYQGEDMSSVRVRPITPATPPKSEKADDGLDQPVPYT